MTYLPFLANGEELPEGFRVMDPTPHREATAEPPRRRRRWIPRTTEERWTWLAWGGVPGGYYRRDLYRLFERQGFRCERCSEETRLYAVRRIPVARGGTNYIGNLVALCARCKERKHGLTMTELRMKERRIQRNLERIAEEPLFSGNGYPTRVYQRMKALATERGFMRADGRPVTTSDEDACVCKKGQAVHIRGSMVCKEYQAPAEEVPWWTRDV